ncbi:hypothetical protein CC86DRAFT_464732 [Ophiobolus disseminans]|uniref:Homeobox domain-containing protein n=1 Tax=Ophiobolus disseminans TaxID=1469910 RepID=A0A6A7A768_9PLEO|nr:hypothetical protein CC86DRAFT_464732 [Ophiobolus disseminans]
MDPEIFHLELDDGQVPACDLAVDLPSDNHLPFDDTFFDFSSFDDVPISYPSFPVSGSPMTLDVQSHCDTEGDPVLRPHAAIEPLIVPVKPVEQVLKSSDLPPATKDRGLNRSKISQGAKHELMAQFSRDPYPSNDIRTKLADVTGLTERSVNNWFTNTRARTIVVPQVEEAEVRIDARNDFWDPLHSRATTSAIPIPTLHRTNSIAGSVGSVASVAHSVGSMMSVDSRGPRQGRRRWAASQTPDHYGMAGFSSRVVTPDSGFCSENVDMEREWLHTIKNWTQPEETAKEPGREIQADEAVRRRGKWHDERQPEEERRMEVYQRQQAERDKVIHNEAKQQKNLDAKRLEVAQKRYFCTWPDCVERFRHRFEWERHEEAKHYRPYRWVCCAEQANLDVLEQCAHCHELEVPILHGNTKTFAACALKPMEERTFFRRDQLAPHIKRHLEKGGGNKCVLSKFYDLLEAWESDNPDMEASALYCGFCGATFETWKERAAHVSDHMQHGVCEFAWWTGRLPKIDVCELTRSTTASFVCPICSKEYVDFDSATREHLPCTMWSCRNLHDQHSLFEIRTNKIRSRFFFSCRLCNFSETGNVLEYGVQQYLMRHAIEHRLHACQQGIFTTEALFVDHLVDEHGANNFWADGTLGPWESEQHFERRDGSALALSTKVMEESELCPSKQPKPSVTPIAL